MTPLGQRLRLESTGWRRSLRRWRGAILAFTFYYDNGQSDVSLILRDAFALFSSKIEFVPNVTPEKYKLFQVADMIATLELVRLKLETEGRISDAEKEFFLSIQNLKKNFLKPTARKRHE